MLLLLWRYLKCFMYGCLLVCVRHMCAWRSCPREEGVGSPRTGMWAVYHGCCWDPNLCFLEKQVLLTTELSLQPPGGNLLNSQLSRTKIQSTWLNTPHLLSLSTFPDIFPASLYVLSKSPWSALSAASVCMGAGPTEVGTGTTSLKKAESLSPSNHH